MLVPRHRTCVGATHSCTWYDAVVPKVHSQGVVSCGCAVVACGLDWQTSNELDGEFGGTVDRLTMRLGARRKSVKGRSKANLRVLPVRMEMRQKKHE